MDNLKPVERRFLTLIGQLGCATPEQLNRVYYSRGSVTTTHQILKCLAVGKYITPVDWNIRGKLRSIYLAYKLSSRGFRTLSRDIDPDSLIHGSSINFTEHFRDANEPIIKALEIQKLEQSSINHFIIDYPHFKDQNHTPDLEVRFECDVSLKQRPLGTLSGYRSPDAFVSFTNRNTEGYAALLFEWDTGSITNRQKIRDRIYDYLQLDDSATLRDRLHVEAIRVVWICKSQKRAMALCEEASHMINPNGSQKDLFLFGTELQADPIRFYFDPIWVLITGERTTLLPDVWRQRWLRSS